MKKQAAFRSVKMLIMDCDGVLTDGSIRIDDEGREVKVFNVTDGAGLAYLRRAGLKLAIVSGRLSMALFYRARELGIRDVFQKELDKLIAYREIKKKFDVPDSEVCYIGDDLPDIPVMRLVGLPIAVANAHPEVKKIAAYITRARGGAGAVRECAEKILKAQGKWDEILSKCGVASPGTKSHAHGGGNPEGGR
ncbi:MAG: HAD hydrolase family protein [Planctomycetota bacterium]|nr:HAD hydrolase family protein [Planctomycetota bacterium]